MFILKNSIRPITAMLALIATLAPAAAGASPGDTPRATSGAAPGVAPGTISATTPSAIMPSAYLTQGYNALVARDYAKAHNLLTQAVRACPQDAAARRYLAASMTSIGRPGEAIKQVQAAQYLNGKQPHDEVMLANAYFASSDMENAKKHYREAQKDATTYGAGTLGLMRSHLSSGELNEASRLCETLNVSRLTRAELSEFRTLSDELSRLSAEAAQITSGKG